MYDVQCRWGLLKNIYRLISGWVRTWPDGWLLHAMAQCNNSAIRWRLGACQGWAMLATCCVSGRPCARGACCADTQLECTIEYIGEKTIKSKQSGETAASSTRSHGHTAQLTCPPAGGNTKSTAMIKNSQEQSAAKRIGALVRHLNASNEHGT